MSKRYLIRRNLETFLGPYTVDELKQAYQRMEFGLQDEVCGSFGEWSAFDDLDKIEDHYPELIIVVKETMLGGWGFSQNTATRIIDKNTKGKKSSSTPSSRGNGLTVFLIFIILAAAGSAYYLARHSSWGPRFFKMSRNNPAGQFEKLLRSGEKSSFKMHFRKKLQSILKDARKSKANLNDWLPSMRAYAFLTEGSVPGVSSKYIRGQDAGSAPKNCTLQSWKNEWKGAGEKLKSFATGYPTNQRLEKWQKLLVWDPYWVARRSSHADWIYPKNYFHGCLVMADRAFNSVYPQPIEGKTRHVELVRNRLKQLVSIAENGKIFAYLSEPLPEPEALPENQSEDVPQGLVALIGCFDEAANQEDLVECTNEGSINGSWKQYLTYRTEIALVRIQFNEVHATVSNEKLKDLSKGSGSLARSDVVTGLQYKAESRFVRNLLRNNGDVTKAVNELKYDHQNVDVLIGH